MQFLATLTIEPYRFISCLLITTGLYLVLAYYALSGLMRLGHFRINNRSFLPTFLPTFFMVISCL